jgi:hypothetical protein
VSLPILYPAPTLPAKTPSRPVGWRQLIRGWTDEERLECRQLLAWWYRCEQAFDLLVVIARKDVVVDVANGASSLWIDRFAVMHHIADYS